MDVILVSVFLKVEQNSHGYDKVFSFKGPYLGKMIKLVKLRGDSSFEKKGEYIIHLRVVKVEGTILYGNILRSKNIKYQKADFL